MNIERATGYFKDYQDHITARTSPLASRSTNHPKPERDSDEDLVMRLRSGDYGADAMDVDEAEDSKPAGLLARLQREAKSDSADDEHLQLAKFKGNGDVKDPLRMRPLFLSDSARQLRQWRQKAIDEDSDLDDDGRPVAFTQSWDRKHRELTYEDMHNMFPTIPGSKAPETLMLDAGTPCGAPRKKGRSEGVNRWKAHQLRQTKKQKPVKKKANAVSDLGLFDLLPGELRNYIYRLAFVPPSSQQPVRIEGSDLICGNGACIHWKACHAAPGIASSCKQIRNELMPIYCQENTFIFDTVMVRNRCAAAWIKSLNTYARFLRQVTLEIILYDRAAPIDQPNNQTVSVIVFSPNITESGNFEIIYDPMIPAEKLKEAKIEAFIEKLNAEGAGVRSQASGLRHLMASDELSDLVFYLASRTLRQSWAEPVELEIEMWWASHQHRVKKSIPYDVFSERVLRWEAHRLFTQMARVAEMRGVDLEESPGSRR